MFTTEMLIEMIGYLGSLLVVVSMLMSSVIKLRVINLTGSVIFTIYAFIIKTYPTAFMNICLCAINVYYLIRLCKANSRHYDLIDGKTEESYLKYFLNHYKEDIKKFFPGFSFEQAVDAVYMVFCDAAPAGLLLGNEEDGIMEILLDYSTPQYRDCSVGNFIFNGLKDKGIRKLVYKGDLEAHEEYLKKTGFVKEDGVYVKTLV